MLIFGGGNDNDPDATMSGLEAGAKIGKIDRVFFIPEQARSILQRQKSWQYPGNPASILLMGSKTSGIEKNSLGKLFGAKVVESWGNSEGLGTITSWEDLSLRPDSIGRPFIGEHVLVVEENGEPVQRETVGRIAGTESTMFTEYAGAPDATASAKRSGLVLSGDIGYRDHNGYLYILGRTDDVAQLKDGNWITVDIIERQVTALGFVKDVAAVIRTGSGQVTVGLLVHLHEETGEAKRLAEIEVSLRRTYPDKAIHLKTLVAKEIPRLVSGKTDRVRIREILGWSK